MLKEYKTQTIICVWGGFLFCGLGYLAAHPDSPHPYFGYALFAGGYLMNVCGAYMYARGKGYSALAGLLGVFWAPGLLVLYVLRDRSGAILKKRRREEGLS
ncbi:MAG: hypothetical protein WC732_03790 [Candidatus Omnitrophota bacterium]